MLNFAIIQSNNNISDHISHMLESIFIKHDFDAEVGLITCEVNKLFNYIENNKVDVLLLDIDLNSSLTGLEVAEKVRKSNKDCYLILETAHIEYALVAYRYKTFDFICKPISYKRLEDCIIRLFDDISIGNKKFIKLDNKNTIVAENEIKYIEKFGTKLVFHTNSHNYETYNSFSRIQSKLPSNFVRCHKSFIANIDNIIKIEASDNIVYFGDSSCDIGPKYKNEFLEVVNNHGIFS